MSAMPKKLLTPAEYLEIERKAEFKSEFFDGEMFPMHGPKRPPPPGETVELDRDQCIGIFSTALRERPHLFAGAGTADGGAGSENGEQNPVVIVEILERGAEFVRYSNSASLQEHILIDEGRLHIERRVRQPDGTWNIRFFADANEPFEFATIPVRIAMADIYLGVKLPKHPPLR